MDQGQRIFWKRRNDLVMQASGSGTWVIKDPVTLDYFVMSASEFAIFSALDGRKTLSQFAAILDRTADDDFEHELKGFFSRLIGNNLVLGTALGYGKLVAQRSERKQNSTSQRLSRFNFISFRWRGVDPQSFLQKLDSLVGWIYSPVMLLLCLILFAAALLVLVQQSLQPEFIHLDVRPIFTFQNLPILMFAIIVIKILHELGHGLTCVHYGGECHELGVLFIVFFPLLYCDTTDSWLRQSHWQRAQVAGAGMFVELVIASICCLLWATSVPGILHTAFLNIMLVCSLNTLLVNGNPLLRYDGYYLISDLLNVPNLGPDSRMLTQSWFDRLVYGSPVTAGMELSLWNLPKALYGIASTLYRAIVLITIAWAVHRMLKWAGIEQLTLLLLAPMFLSLVFSLTVFAVQRWQTIAKSGSSSGKLRAIIGVFGLLIGAGIALSVPLPHTVIVPFTLEPGLCRPVYVTVPGRLESIISAESSIEPGDVIAELHNAEIERAVARTESELSLRELHLKNLETFRSSSQLANTSLPAASQALAIARQRFEAEQLLQSRLTVKSSLSGTFFPPRNLQQQKTTEHDLQFWSGRPTDDVNQSAWLREQTILGWLGQKTDFRAVAYVPQDQLEFIRENADSRLVFLSAPNAECYGTVSDIGTERVEFLPREIVRNQLSAVDPLAGQMRPLETLYRVQLKIDVGATGTLYSTGFAKIECAPRSIAARLWRLISHTFAIEG